MESKVVLVTGASSGIGMTAAIELKQKGFIVYGAARRMDRMESLKKHGIHILPLDVTKEESMNECVKTILEKEGRIDILVNNAGYGFYGAIETVSMEDARNQMEVNVFGLAYMIKLVLPAMRAQKSGRIINISSMAGKICTPFGAWYHATKYSVEALSDCLRMEVKPFGIDVVLVEPGGIKTDWGIIAAKHLSECSKGTAYAASATKVSNGMHNMYTKNKSLSSPDIISHAIVKASLAKKPKCRYLIGYGAKLSVACSRILSARMFDKLIYKVMSE